MARKVPEQLALLTPTDWNAEDNALGLILRLFDGSLLNGLALGDANGADVAVSDGGPLSSRVSIRVQSNHESKL